MERLSVDRIRADEKLIEMVKRFPCLWEIHSKSFRDLSAKETAWKVVSQEVGYSDEDCLKRWKALRDRFVREAKKVKENMTPDGTSGYVPPWSLFESMGFLMDSIRHRNRSSMLTMKRNSTAMTFPEDSTEAEASADGEFLSAGSPGGSSVDLNSSPSHQAKRRKSSRLPIPFVVGPTLSDPRLPPGKDGGAGSVQPDVTQVILKSLKALEETVQEQQRVIDDEDELFGKQVAMVMRRLSSKQKAMAKLQIQQVFLNVEFPPDTPTISN